MLTVGGEATWFRILDFPVRSQSLLTGLMFNNETRLLADGSLIIHSGGRLEQIVDTPNATDLGEDLRVVDRHFNPRLAVIWKLGENHNLRIAAASAFRTPTPYDLFLRLGVQLSEPPIPPVAFITGNPRLRPEDLRSLEVGYRGILFDALRVDAVAFGQQIRDVIGDIPLNILPSVRQNLYGYDQVGLELGLKYYPTRTLSASFNYSFLYSSDHRSGDQVKDYPVHLYGLGAELRLPWRSRITTDAYLVFDYKPSVSYFVGLDSFNPYIQWERVQAPDQIFWNLRYGRFFLDDRAELFLMARNIVGFFRDPKGLKMWPVESAQPIGGLISWGSRSKAYRFLEGKVTNMRGIKKNRRWGILGASVLALLAVASCGSEYPPDTGGGTIRGTLYYEGDGLDDSEEPALVVAAFAVNPSENPLEAGIPHASNMFIRPTFTGDGIPYEMQGLVPWTDEDGKPGGYTVLATLIDSKNTSASTQPDTLGFFPNFCEPVKVVVQADSPQVDVDVTLYDAMGLLDPCVTGGTL